MLGLCSSTTLCMAAAGHHTHAVHHSQPCAQAAALRVCLAYMHPEAASDAEFLTNKEWGRPRKRKKPWMPTVPVGELPQCVCVCQGMGFQQ